MRLLLLALLLSITTQTSAATYGNLDPCIIVDNQKTCLASATPDEIQAWDKFWMTDGYYGDDEKQALSNYRKAQWADVGTTVTGLVFCTAVVEANPLGAAIPLGKWLHYKYLERSAKKTPRIYSMAAGINTSAVIAVVPAAWNLGVLAKCL